MAKDKTAGETIETATETAQNAFTKGTETLKSNFDKALKGYDTLLGFSKENLEACLKSANAAGKGAEALQNHIYGYSKQAIEESIAHTRSLMSSKSVHEALELQTGFAKSAIEGYIEQLTKTAEIFSNTGKEAFAPIQGRFQAFAEIVQTPRAA